MTDPNLANREEAIHQMPDVPYKIIGDIAPSFWDHEQPDDVYRIHDLGSFDSANETFFSEDLTQGVYTHGTVTVGCIQVAAYIGCTEIYLLGVDFSQLINKRGRDSHFIKNYNAEDSDEDLECGYLTDEILQGQMYIGYSAARKYADTHPPLKIYNATRGGYLEVFERVNFDSLF